MFVWLKCSLHVNLAINSVPVRDNLLRVSILLLRVDLQKIARNLDVILHYTYARAHTYTQLRRDGRYFPVFQRFLFLYYPQ